MHGSNSPFSSRKPFPLLHYPLVTNIDEHLELFNRLVLLGHLGLELVNLLLLLLLNSFEVILRLLQFASKISPDPVLRRLIGFRVNSWFIFRNARGNFGWIAVNGSPGIINITR